MTQREIYDSFTNYALIKDYNCANERGYYIYNNNVFRVYVSNLNTKKSPYHPKETEISLDLIVRKQTKTGTWSEIERIHIHTLSSDLKTTIHQKMRKIEIANYLDKMHRDINSDIYNEFTKIANKYLNIETLETRMSDSLDFHDVSVWGVLDALTEAYKLGFEHGKRKK